MFLASRTIVWMLKGLALILVLGLVALAGLAVRTIQRHDIRILGVQSGSMEPAIKTGDAVVVKKANTDSLSAGDVISYRTTESGTLTTHRIHSTQPDTREIVTKGDANSWPDGKLTDSQITGEAIAIAPYAGKAANILRSPAGLIIFIYMPVTAIILYEARRLQHNLRRPYRLQR